MSEETVRIMTERDFVVFLGQIAGKLRDTDWGPSTDDLSESLYGMTEHLDNTSSTDTRDVVRAGSALRIENSVEWVKPLE